MVHLSILPEGVKVYGVICRILPYAAPVPPICAQCSPYAPHIARIYAYTFTFVQILTFFTMIAISVGAMLKKMAIFIKENAFCYGLFHVSSLGDDG